MDGGVAGHRAGRVSPPVHTRARRRGAGRFCLGKARVGRGQIRTGNRGICSAGGASERARN